ncbi:uncharacterized protein SOCEGT47_043900 [Sorangium cellulosum]|uniref:Uncharacterized protein n=1 Tax=Sorangium cellulosum TaxID=56 RepID=A0A4P2Q3G1_SORCE|nr:uncharacterized protein SOCEGT47_043900 [Sorangium cellulosum]
MACRHAVFNYATQAPGGPVTVQSFGVIRGNYYSVPEIRPWFRKREEHEPQRRRGRRGENKKPLCPLWFLLT